MKLNLVNDTLWKINGKPAANLGMASSIDNLMILKCGNTLYKAEIGCTEKYTNKVNVITKEECLDLLPELM